ncbi:hypothetical protein [Polluticoccus soli]|uniref:hypothetical protein n=1 Tax=Polluticoccus soli TaxID=3034150 RepID=UPI0023E2A7C8|nr:hypothetical protein [Flavipsychrobacter sp. JY13-12]
MRLSRLLLLAAIGYGINAFLKTQRGKDVKNDLMHRVDGWKKDVENLVSNIKNRKSTTSSVDSSIDSSVGSMY